MHSSISILIIPHSKKKFPFGKNKSHQHSQAGGFVIIAQIRICRSTAVYWRPYYYYTDGKREIRPKQDPEALSVRDTGKRRLLFVSGPDLVMQTGHLQVLNMRGSKAPQYGMVSSIRYTYVPIHPTRIQTFASRLALNPKKILLGMTLSLLFRDPYQSMRKTAPCLISAISEQHSLQFLVP